MSLPKPPSLIDEDAGTDAAPRDIAQTQSTPPSNSGYVTDPNFLDANAGPQTEFNPNNDPNTNIGAEWQGVASPGTEPGVGAPSDDGTTEGILAAGAQAPGTSVTNGFISPLPNALNQYASYTYSLSWYLLTPAQFNALSVGPVNVNDWTLLMQSGGIGTGNRNQYFPLDYYMDNLILSSKMIPSTVSAHNVVELEFTVSEPNGITLINNLSDAVIKLANETNDEKQIKNYVQANHCMVVNFYGYDENGNPINTGNFGVQQTTEGNNVSPALQKIYPFYLTKLDFRLTNRHIEYHIQGKPHVYTLLASSKRASIPANFELVGRTVGDILSGNGSTGTRVQLDDGRKSTTTVQTPPSNSKVGSLPTNQQAAIAAGTDYNLVNEDGMAFGGGGLTGA